MVLEEEELESRIANSPSSGRKYWLDTWKLSFMDNILDEATARTYVTSLMENPPLSEYIVDQWVAEKEA